MGSRGVLGLDMKSEAEAILPLDDIRAQASCRSLVISPSLCHDESRHLRGVGRVAQGTDLAMAASMSVSASVATCRGGVNQLTIRGPCGIKG